MPPIKSLTSSINLDTSKVSEGSVRESSRISNLLDGRKSLRLSMLTQDVSGVESIASSIETGNSDSVFESSISIDMSDGNFSAEPGTGMSMSDVNSISESDMNSGPDVRHRIGSDGHCTEKCCNSHSKAPSRQENMLDDTPQMHRTDESVWNSYAARNLRSMRDGVYSEDSDEGDSMEQGSSDEKETENIAICRDTSECSVPVRKKTELRRTKSFTYHSDEECDSVSFNRDRRKRKFIDVTNSPISVPLQQKKSGLTQEINLLGLKEENKRMRFSSSFVGDLAKMDNGMSQSTIRDGAGHQKKVRIIFVIAG